MTVQKSTIYFDVASTLERNRLVNVTKSTNVAAYSSYGSAPDGWLSTRATVADGAAVLPIASLEQTKMVKLQTAVASAGDPVVCGANGQVIGTLTATVISRTQPYTQPAGSQGDIYIAPANVTAWTSPTQCVAGEILTKGASVWTRTTATAGMLVYVTDEKRYYVCSDTNTWVLAKVVGYAKTVGATGEEIEIYETKDSSRVLPEQLPANLNYIVVAAGQGTVSAAGTTLVITDERITTACFAFASCVSASGTAPGTIKCVITSGVLTITITAPGGSDTTVLNYQILKNIA